MPLPTGENTRTITGYARVLLDFPRYVIERDVDFTDCHLGGHYDQSDGRCASCDFGEACVWLNANAEPPPAADALPQLLAALDTAVNYLHARRRDDEEIHGRGCPCDACEWLREAKSFLRLHRHRR